MFYVKFVMNFMFFLILVNIKKLRHKIHSKVDKFNLKLVFFYLEKKLPKMKRFET